MCKQTQYHAVIVAIQSFVMVNCVAAVPLYYFLSTGGPHRFASLKRLVFKRWYSINCYDIHAVRYGGEKYIHIQNPPGEICPRVKWSSGYLHITVLMVRRRHDNAQQKCPFQSTCPSWKQPLVFFFGEFGKLFVEGLLSALQPSVDGRSGRIRYFCALS